MAYLTHDYGIKDLSEDYADKDLGVNSRNFGEDHLITPQVEKLPLWAEYFWNEVTITPYGRLKSGNIVGGMKPAPFIIGETKPESSAPSMIDSSVIAQSVFIRKTLDRDDVVDLADFDIIAYLKKVMARNTKLYIAESIFDASSRPMSPEAIRPVTEYNLLSLDNVMNGSEYTTGEETLFINPSAYRTTMTNMSGILTRSQFADLYGFKDVLFVPNLSNPIIFDVKKYYIGLPRGKEGEVFDKFNLDKNTKEVLYELKVCGLYTNGGPDIS